MSSFVRASSVAPCTMTPYLEATTSNPPTLLGLPVAAPNSCPAPLNAAASSPKNSHVNGPSPTQLEYALIMPTMLSSFANGMPAPMGAYAAMVEDAEVYG